MKNVFSTFVHTQCLLPVPAYFWQCDQIWQKLATSAKILKVIEGLFST